MKIAHDVLKRFVPVPDSPRALRELLDDLGLEVKRMEHDGTSTVYTLELLANRGDHHCYEGVATEIAVRRGTKIEPPPIAPLMSRTPLTEFEQAARAIHDRPPFPELRIESPRCLVYSATLLEKTGEGSLHADDSRTLQAAGLQSLGPAIDATNLANLELGQPTHAFDADTLRGPVVIRDSRPGERALPLFHEAPVILPEGTLVIADDEKILAIAGVIGCEESKTTPETKRILLESATFDPVAVRKASRALNIHTDSSARFERGADPTAPLRGAGRVVQLLEGAGFRRMGPTVLLNRWTDPERRIALDLAATNAFLDTALTSAQVESFLTGYGFTVEAEGAGRWTVQVPPHRVWEVAHVQDLYEELARAVGFNDTPIALPPVDRGALPTPAERRRARVDEVLIGLGFYEVITDGFYGREVIELLDLQPGHPLHDHVETANALDRAYSLLKNNALAQAVEAVATNLNRKNTDIRAFEWTRLFFPEPGAREGKPPLTRPCREESILWAVANGTEGTRWAGQSRPADLWFLKGAIEELAVALGLPLGLGPADPDAPLAHALHPSRQATITSGDAVVGILGEVHPAVLQRARIKAARPVFLQIAADALLASGTRPAYSEPPPWQPIVRSLAFTLPFRFPAARVVEHLRASGPPWLARVEITDRFVHADERPPPVTLTFSLHFENDPADQRSAEEVNQITEGLIAAVEERFGSEGVKLR